MRVQIRRFINSLDDRFLVATLIIEVVAVVLLVYVLNIDSTEKFEAHDARIEHLEAIISGAPVIERGPGGWAKFIDKEGE